MEKDLLAEIQSEYNHPKRKKREKKIEKKTSIRTYLASFVLVTVLIVIGVAYGLEKYANWRAGHEWQFPTKWVGMVREVELSTSTVVKAEEPKALTDMETLEQYKLSPVLKTVYLLESTSGKSDGCKDEGKFNGFGFAQNSSQWKCYNSFADVAERVNEWFEEVLAANGNDLVDAVCYYNKGVHGLTSCGDYSANFFSVLTKNF